MIHQCSIREPKLRSVAVAKLINDAATIQRPEAQVPNQNSHYRAWLDRCKARKQLNPAQLEVSPFGECPLGPREGIRAMADDCTGRADVQCLRGLFSSDKGRR